MDFFLVGRIPSKEMHIVQAPKKSFLDKVKGALYEFLHLIFRKVFSKNLFKNAFSKNGIFF